MWHLRPTQGFTVKTVPTKPIAGQKTGTSGLRKKTKEFMSEHYLANWWVLLCWAALLVTAVEPGAVLVSSALAACAGAGGWSCRWQQAQQRVLMAAKRSC